MANPVQIKCAAITKSLFTQPSQSRSTELGLMSLAWIITVAFYVLASLGAHGTMPQKIWIFLFGIVIISLGMHFALKRFAPNSSQILLPIATLLNGIGYVEIARWNSSRAAYQSIWYLLSAVAFVLTLKFVRSVRDLDRYRYLTLSSAIMLLLMPLIPGIGVNVNGARLWVRAGPLSFQPVEIAKLLLAFFFASYFASNRELLSTPTQRFMGRLIVPPKALFPIIAAWGFALAILGGENDIGFAMILFALFFSLLWITTGLKTYIAMGFGLFIVGSYGANIFFTQVHHRISQWLNPWSAINFNFSHQLAFGWFSLAAGGITGTGLGLGQSGNIPEISSDMIFSALGEELGFLGVILILCLFAMFVGEGFRIAQRAHSDFVRLVAVALTATMGFQAFFIMAGVLRILPFTGITLPFMAYGGSSLISNYVIVAVLLRISQENANELRGGEVRAVKFI